MQLPGAKMEEVSLDEEGCSGDTPGGLLELQRIVKKLKPTAAAPCKGVDPSAADTLPNQGVEVARQHDGRSHKRAERVRKLEGWQAI